MAPDVLFKYANLLAMAGWIILIFLPRRWPALLWVPQFWIPGVLALGYSGLMLSGFGTTDGGFGSISEVRALFSSDTLLTAGWVHYLAFDLFIGAWIAKASDQAGISRIIQAPILAATFMFGPMGLLLFFLTRAGLAAFVRPEAA
ncbi:MAG: ABA4-like family protein [Parvularculaceae bacterium]|nr:ABA4-like family protein [Parvularculaceae bacterium]